MKMPIPVKIIITGYTVLALGVFLVCAYAAYLGFNIDASTFTDFQRGFVEGLGYNQYNFSSGASGEFAGRFAPTVLACLLSIFAILRRMSGLFAIVFIIDALLFTGGIGYILKIIVIGLLAVPSSRSYFKKEPTIEENIIADTA